MRRRIKYVAIATLLTAGAWVYMACIAEYTLLQIYSAIARNLTAGRAMFTITDTNLSTVGPSSVFSAAMECSMLFWFGTIPSSMMIVRAANKLKHVFGRAYGRLKYLQPSFLLAVLIAITSNRITDADPLLTLSIAANICLSACIPILFTFRKRA